MALQEALDQGLRTIVMLAIVVRGDHGLPDRQSEIGAPDTSSRMGTQGELTIGLWTHLRGAIDPTMRQVNCPFVY